jgi:hypothetical protein
MPSVLRIILLSSVFLHSPASAEDTFTCCLSRRYRLGRARAIASRWSGSPRRRMPWSSCSVPRARIARFGSSLMWGKAFSCESTPRLVNHFSARRPCGPSWMRRVYNSVPSAPNDRPVRNASVLRRTERLLLLRTDDPVGQRWSASDDRPKTGRSQRGTGTGIDMTANAECNPDVTGTTTLHRRRLKCERERHRHL